MAVGPKDGHIHDHVVAEGALEVLHLVEDDQDECLGGVFGDFLKVVSYSI